jgi:hypothetical protein
MYCHLDETGTIEFQPFLSPENFLRGKAQYVIKGRELVGSGTMVID